MADFKLLKMLYLAWLPIYITCFHPYSNHRMSRTTLIRFGIYGMDFILYLYGIVSDIETDFD